jgi:hypothetical protein
MALNTQQGKDNMNVFIGSVFLSALAPGTDKEFGFLGFRQSMKLAAFSDLLKVNNLLKYLI